MDVGESSHRPESHKKEKLTKMISVKRKKLFSLRRPLSGDDFWARMVFSFVSALMNRNEQDKMLEEMKDGITETQTQQGKMEKTLEKVMDGITEIQARQVKQEKMLEEAQARQVKQEKMLEEAQARQVKQEKMLMDIIPMLSKRSCSTQTQFQGPTSIGNLQICGSGSNHLTITSSDMISDKESDYQTSDVENDCSASSSAQEPAEMSHQVDSPPTCIDFHRENEGNQSDVSCRYIKKGNDVDLPNVQYGQHGQKSISYLALGDHQHDQTDHSDHHDNVHVDMDLSKGQTGLKMFDERDDQSDLDSDDDERHDTGRKDDNEEDIPSPDGVFHPSKPDLNEIDDGGVLPGLSDPHLSGISFLKEPSRVSEGTPIDQGHDGSSGMQLDAFVETSEESVLLDSSLSHQNVDGVDMPSYRTELDGLYINSVSEIDFRPVSTVKNGEMEICTNLSVAASSASERSRPVVSTFPQLLNQFEFTSNADFKKTLSSLSSSKGNLGLVPSSGIPRSDCGIDENRMVDTYDDQTFTDTVCTYTDSSAGKIISKEKTDRCREESVSETLPNSTHTDDGTEQSERVLFPSVPHTMPAGIGWYRSATPQDIHIRNKPGCEGLSTNLSLENEMPPLHLMESKGVEAHRPPFLSCPVWVGNSVNSTGGSFSATLSETEQAGNGIIQMKRSLITTVADSVCAGNGIQGTRRPHSAPLLCSAGFGSEVRVSEHSVGDGQLGPEGPLSASCPDVLHSADGQPKL